MAGTAITRLGSGGSIVWAILLIIFGFLAIALPFATSWGVVVIIAWLIVFSGGFQFIHAFQSKGAGHIIWKLLVAIVYLIVGIYFLLNPIWELPRSPWRWPSSLWSRASSTWCFTSSNAALREQVGSSSTASSP